jgi:aspartyl-tRNA(Asn)/glutamyl-tRNA(Gln) amidotransferase subunit A
LESHTSFSDLSKSLGTGKTTCRKVVERYLEQIAKHKALNAFIEVFEDSALSRADEIDLKIADGKAGKLAGMVVGIKDVLCYKDHSSTAGSQILKGYNSPYSSTAVERLESEDAIIIGRQNCDEFAMGSSNENSSYGPAINGIGENRVPGGSSGGSAVSVQMDMCRVSLGTDTGGSVRQPASFCGVYGLKPSYSRVSRYGLIAYGSSFDCIGVFSKNIEDMALTLEVIAGHDPNDATSSTLEVPDYSKPMDEQGPRTIGVIEETLSLEGINPAVLKNTRNFVQQLENAGHKIKMVHSKFLEYALPVYYILTTAEASTNLSRFDGVRYGHRTRDPKNLMELYENTRTEGFGEEVKRRVMLGTFVLTSSYYDAYFTKAQKVRKLIQEELKTQFKEVDFILSPTTPTPAFRLGEKSENILEMYLADIFTAQAPLGGFPAISLPYGKDPEGMPLGIHLMADSFKERELLEFSKKSISLVQN